MKAGPVRTLKERVNELAALEAGWLNGEGTALTADALESGLTVAEVLAGRAGEHWTVFPSVDGALVFEEVSEGVPDAFGAGRWVRIVDVLATGLCEVLLLNLDSHTDEGDLERVDVPAGAVGIVLLALCRLRDVSGEPPVVSGVVPGG